MDKSRGLDPFSDEYEIDQCIKEFVQTEKPRNPTPYDTKQSQTHTRINSLEKYESMYQKSLHSPETFWKDIALEIISWNTTFTNVFEG